MRNDTSSPCTQAAANAFAADFEAILQTLEADPLAPIPGHGSAPLNCIRLCALRCALLSAIYTATSCDARRPSLIEGCRFAAHILGGIEKFTVPQYTARKWVRTARQRQRQSSLSSAYVRISTSAGSGHGRLVRRDACLRAQGFEDPFREVKQEEDAKALALLPAVLRCCSSHDHSCSTWD